LVHHDHAASGIWWRRERPTGDLTPLPVTENLLDTVEGLIGRYVADDRKDRVVRREILAMEGEQILTGNGTERRRRPALRQPVRVETENETVEDRVRDKTGIFEVHLQR